MPSRVTTTVCSKCADRLPSRVTAVQPSDSTFTAGLPAFTIGSIASTMPFRQPRPASGRPVVGNLRLLVQRRADAVTDELAHHRKPVRLDVLLHRRADVRDPRARLHRVDPAKQRFLGHAQQLGRLRRDRARPAPSPRSRRRTRRASRPCRSTRCRRSTSGRVRRNAVHDLLVHRRAHRRRIAVVPLERRLGSRLAHPSLGQLVDVRRRHARRHDLPQLGENPRHELVDPSQLLNLSSATGRRSRRAPFTAHRRRRVVDQRVRARAPHAPAPARRSRRGTSAAHGSTRAPASWTADRPSDAPARRPGRRRRAAPARRRTCRTPSPSSESALVPHFEQIRRLPSRRTSSGSGTATSTTISGPLSRAVHDLVERPACATVRGNPSSTNPGCASGFASRSRRWRSSSRRRPARRGPSAPWPRAPSGCFSLMASRRMSPVEIFGKPRSRANRPAWVPFPAPGGPIMMTFSPMSSGATLGVRGSASSS